MKSSLLGRIGRAAVGELAGQVQAMRDRALALHLLGGGARSAARARREDDAVGDRVARGAVGVEQQFSSAVRTKPSIGGRHLGVVEPLLRLSLELRLLRS